MTDTPNAIRPIYDIPDHDYYGPVRLLWEMLEQLFADYGGVAALEVAMAANASARSRGPWYDHYAWLLRQGQSQCQAGRIVMQQLLVTAEYLL